MGSCHSYSFTLLGLFEVLHYLISDAVCSTWLYEAKDQGIHVQEERQPRIDPSSLTERTQFLSTCPRAWHPLYFAPGAAQWRTVSEAASGMIWHQSSTTNTEGVMPEGITP